MAERCAAVRDTLWRSHISGQQRLRPQLYADLPNYF